VATLRRSASASSARLPPPSIAGLGAGQQLGVDADGVLRARLVLEQLGEDRALDCDLLVEVLGDVGVVADRDQHRRRGVAVLLPALEGGLPLAGQGLQSSLGLAHHGLRLGLAAARGPVLGRQRLVDGLPEAEILGDGLAGVVGHRHPRDLDDAALDGVHQAEVGDDPGQGGAFGVAAALDVEGGGRQIEHDVDAPGGVNGVQPADPDRGLLLGGLELGPLLGAHAVGPAVVVVGRGAIGVVRLVVDHQQVLLAAQVAQHAVGEGRGALLPALHHLALAAVVPHRQRVPVGDQHPPLPQIRQQRRRHEVEPLEIVPPRPRQPTAAPAPIPRRQHRPRLPSSSSSSALRLPHFRSLPRFPSLSAPAPSQPLLHRQIRRDDQDAVGEAPVLRVERLVDEAPGHQHGHDHRLAAAGGHLDGVAGERLGLAVQRRVQGDVDAQLAVAAHLHQPDDGLGGLELAEEEAALAVRAGPVRQQLAGDRGGAGVAGLAPGPHLLADLVDHAQLLELLVGEHGELALVGPRPRPEIVAGRPPPVLDARHAGRVVQPVALRLAVGGVEDGVVDGEGHSRGHAFPVGQGSIEAGGKGDGSRIAYVRGHADNARCHFQERGRQRIGPAGVEHGAAHAGWCGQQPSDGRRRNRRRPPGRILQEELTGRVAMTGEMDDSRLAAQQRVQQILTAHSPMLRQVKALAETPAAQRLVHTARLLVHAQARQVSRAGSQEEDGASGESGLRGCAGQGVRRSADDVDHAG
jgi:hypothetical protein